MAKWWKSLSATWRRVLQKDSNLQKEIDTYRLLLALTHRELHKEEDSVTKALQRADAIADSTRESEVQTKVHAQVQMIMATLAAEAGLLSDKESNDTEKLPLEYGLEVKESRIRGAGKGLFMKGDCPDPSSPSCLGEYFSSRFASISAGGDAFHGGDAYMYGVTVHQHLRHLPGFPSLDDPKHMLARGPRGSLVDSYPIRLRPLPLASGVSVPLLDLPSPLEECGGKGGGGGPEVEVGNRLAGGHLVNHAGGSGGSENVMALPYAFGPSLAPWMRPLLPSVPFTPPKGEEGGVTGSLESALEQSLGMKAFGPYSGHFPTQVLISLLPIQDGQEVLLDYRFNPKLKSDWPPWYEVLDPEATNRRWDVSSF